MQIEVDTLDVRQGENAPPLVAYAFGQSGRLLGRSEVAEGRSTLELPELKEPEAIRIIVGPPIDTQDPGEVRSALDRLNAPEISIRPGDARAALRLPVDRELWSCWLRFCTVRGTLLKRTVIGGLPIDLPACGAEVEIYEVDPAPVILLRIPDVVLERIRDLVRKPWPPPPEERFPGGIPFPPIPPGPGPDPAPFLAGGLGIGRAASVANVVGAAGVGRAIGSTPLRQEVMAIMAEQRGGETERVSAAAGEAADGEEGQDRLFAFTSGEATTVEPAEAMASVRALAEVPEIRSAVGVSLSAFKSSLLARPDLLRPLFCWLWPRAVTMQLLATATTDDCGKFRARVYRGCSADTPDLYFKAYRRLGPFRIPIHAPLPVACHTWWNYACGSEVTLTTTHPFARACPSCKPVIGPPHWVLAMAVGNRSLADVRGTGTALQPSTNPSNVGLTSSGEPFGGYIRLRFEFDNTLRTDLDVRYYRVRWRKVGSGNPFLDLAEDVWRHYAHMVGTTLMIEPYRLGPQPVGGTPNLYEIPPALPPTGQWAPGDLVVDGTSAAFPSAALAPAAGGEGDYEFELTLFNSAGVAVNGNTLGVNYVVPTTLDLTATIPTANASTLGLVTAAGRLVFQLHIDNNPTCVALQPPTIGGTASADPCGLLRYGPGVSVTLQWTATHPHGFATFQHVVVRGATELPAPMTSAGPVGPPPGVHGDTHAVSTLLGGCSIAGFVETVSASAMATDGWRQLDEYSRHAIQGFALAPHGA